MQLKKIGALFTALGLALSLVPVPTHAVTFHDIDKHWAKPYIEKMERAGLAKGWQEKDSNGQIIYRFDPDRAMTYAETLLFCSRAMRVPEEIQIRIEDSKKKEIQDALPESVAAWNGAVREFAVAVEGGVISLDELEALKVTNPDSIRQENGVTKSASYMEWYISRQDLCRYLIRAMQLEPLAKTISQYPLQYEDAESISSDLRPYVYLLSNYGIIEGDDTGCFAPDKPVTRAEMITILSRLLDAMDKYGIFVELSEYTHYSWVSGLVRTISQLADESTVITLENLFTGVRETWSIPAGTVIYKDNLAGTAANLAVNSYARLNLDNDGKVISVRVGGPLTEYDGDVASLADGLLSLSGEDFRGSLVIDRFTQTAVGGREIDRTLLDEVADYEQAHCWVDELGHLAAVCFLGGTRTVDGLIWGMSVQGANTVLEVALLNGERRSCILTPKSVVSVDGEIRGLTKKDVGKHILLRVKNDGSEEAENAVVDTFSRYIQGPISSTGRIGGAVSLTIRDIFGTDTTPLPISDSATIFYYNALGRREDRDPTQLSKNWYVTAQLGSGKEKGKIVSLSAYPRAVTQEGILTDIQRGQETLLETAGAYSGIVEHYKLNMNALPKEITRNGLNATMADLRVGDRLKVTLYDSKITKLDATPEISTVTGILFAVHNLIGSTTIQVRLTDGTEKTYPISEDVTIMVDNTSGSLSSLTPGQAVVLTMENDALVSISGASATTSGTMLEGTLWQFWNDETDSGLYLLVNGSTNSQLKVVTNAGTRFLNAATAKDDLTLNDLKMGNRITVMGSQGSGVFHATIIILRD